VMQHSILILLTPHNMLQQLLNDFHQESIKRFDKKDGFFLTLKFN